MIKLYSGNYENQRWGALHKAWVVQWIVQDKFEWTSKYTMPE
jgi:hypothetical protein